VKKQDVEALVEQALYVGPTVLAEQLVGVDACLHQLGGQIALVARPQLAKRFGLEASGTLLIGPPGTGKTTVARFIAGRMNLPFYQMSADQFGSDPELVHAVFRRLAGERAILFIDEISILAQKREWGDTEDRRMLSALLSSLDGLTNQHAPGGLWVIGACTADITLDPAIYRSGRLGVVVEFAPPSESQRRQLFDLYLASVPHAVADEALDRLAEVATGATGADIRDWISQAASLLLAENEQAGGIVGDPVIEYRHLEIVVARRGFVPAEGRPGRAPDLETSLHEAAHAVLTFALFGRAALAKVSVGFGSPGGGPDHFARGHFSVSDEWAMDNQPTSATWPDHVAAALAGACAEETFLGYRGHGAETDVARSTDLILAQLDAADPAFGPSRRAVEVNGGMFGTVVGSQAMRSLAWRLTRARFQDCWQRAIRLVDEHRDSIERLARVLLEGKQTLTGDEIVIAIGEQTTG
jgi:ATP-dependent Zn protease